jgi:hypothetical protein
VINFDLSGRNLILAYQPESTDAAWVRDELDTHGKVTISRAFTFQTSDLVAATAAPDADEYEEPTVRFRFGTRDDGYFRIAGRILGIANDVLIADSIRLERKIFVAERNVGIFRRIAKVKQDNGEIVVGGDRDDSIPQEVFWELLGRFPNSGELDRYATARVETIIGEYFDGMKSARENYEIYLSKRGSSVSGQPLAQYELLQADMRKFVYVRDTIETWLKSEDAYTEQDWQRLILNFILLIFPKYIAILENVPIADFYTSPDRPRRRFIDLCLVDAGGNIDVIEIKKPFHNAILGRTLYRGNSVPTRELSGSIMQAEKYIFHLSKWGVEGERNLSSRYSPILPPNLTIRITNPKAMIILGRDCLPDGRSALTAHQKFDLEVIKRKYANMIDILTYDDLLRRLDNIIASLDQRSREAAPGG